RIIPDVRGQPLAEADGRSPFPPWPQGGGGRLPRLIADPDDGAVRVDVVGLTVRKPGQWRERGDVVAGEDTGRARHDDPEELPARARAAAEPDPEARVADRRAPGVLEPERGVVHLVWQVLG